ncbi:MAG TPA: NAD(P)/FAD-dependent oxidoreductase [Candidatus Limnocylindrales bacterium]|nr:NAD(P)/FAD-dependent oxidoreductase [Candidatus Limnocylindrales bacterium]
MPEPAARPEHFDVAIVGAGLSGIGAAYHLQTRCPGKTYAILEGRDAIGGTWDLFRYPGIRSDSDMYTLGYSFKPWRAARAIADGPSILQYVRETAQDNGIDEHIRFRHLVRRVSWSSHDARWTVEAECDGRTVSLTCSFLFMCAGYYRYSDGYTPDFAGMDAYEGRLVHPQKWPQDLDYGGKRVIVIGSGATAVTLVPAMARTAAHVTMLQRSPTYVVSRPGEDAIANWLRTVLPATTAYALTRWKNVLLQLFFYNWARSRPERVKRALVAKVREILGPDYDVATHFTPRYNPWDQRLCLVPDDDLFDAIKQGSASVETGHIETFTRTGVRLTDGRELEADIIVTATGLVLELLGGSEVFVDGQRIEFSRTLTYKGMMYSDVPNLASAFGYTNASWTLKCDLTCEYVCRLLRHMDRGGYVQATPRLTEPMETEPWLDFTSGYVQRSVARFPRQGKRTPWRLHQNYARDLAMIRFGAIDDGVMEFRGGVPDDRQRSLRPLPAPALIPRASGCLPTRP